MSISRRQFLENIGIVGAIGATGPSLTFGQEEGSGPVDCGPPPKAKPKTRTGGESFAPLPLPVTPLRRSESKRPPSPPALIGKMAMGPTRWVTREGKRVMYRDWMTDPADISTLLKWTNEKLGINYRGDRERLCPLRSIPSRTPAVLFAGHNKFELDDETRARPSAVAVADGGRSATPAVAGTTSPKASAARWSRSSPVVPAEDAARGSGLLGLLQARPVHLQERGRQRVRSDDPCLESIDFGCRAGVIFSPADLTCGWDGHEHPRGTRVVIDEARQVGANLVTYLLGQFQLGRFLSTSKVYYEADAPSRDDFVFAQLVHEGDWDPDPSAVHNLLKHARDNSTLEVKFKRQNVELKDPKTTTYPLLYMTGHREFAWDQDAVGRMQRYLKAGGLLLADACCGRMSFDQAFRREIQKVFPETPLERIPLDHPIYHCHYEVATVDYTPRVREDFGPFDTPELEGISVDGRLVVIYSKFDLGNGWEQFPHAYAYGMKDESAARSAPTRSSMR